MNLFVPVPAKFAHYDLDTGAAARLLGLEAGDVPVDTLPYEEHASRGRLFDYVDVLNFGLLSGTKESVPDLAMRFLLRFAASGPRDWYGPRNWMVRVRAPEAAGDGLSLRRADVTAPGISELDGIPAHLPQGGTAPPGYDVAVQITGADMTVSNQDAVGIYHDMVASLRSREVIYQAVPEELRMDHQHAWSLGMADCVVVSRLLASQLRQRGLTARARRGFLLGIVGSDHSWCEILENDQWKPMDAVFAFLSTPEAGNRYIASDPAFAQACLGSRFNRLLPCLAEEAAPVVHRDGQLVPQWWTCAVSASSWES
jgi:hypothetical protein